MKTPLRDALNRRSVLSYSPEIIPLTMLRFFLPLLLIGSLLSAQSESSFSAYSTFIEDQIAQEEFAGAVSLVVKDGKVLHRGAFGHADLEESTPMAEDQVFHLMSMTKPIVTVAAMILWQEGKFKLDDKVSTYLDGFDNLQVAKSVTEGKDGPTVPALTPVTIRQVMTHTAGFSHGLSGSKLDNEIAMALYYVPQENIASRVKTLTELPLIGQPGKQWSYSASPDILALLIEHFSGMTAAEFLQQRVFDPLGMSSTGYNLPEEKAARMAKLYKQVDGKLVRDPMQMGAMGNKVFGGSHGLLSTADDYAAFCRMLVNDGKYKGGRLLKKSTLEMMTSNQLGDIPYPAGKGFGLGFGIDTEQPKDGLGSAGNYYWSGAYSTFFFVDPVNNLFAILMTQRNPYTGSIGENMRKQVYSALGKR